MKSLVVALVMVSACRRDESPAAKPAAGPCLAQGPVGLQGVLIEGEERDDAGTPHHYFALTLVQPRCVQGNAGLPSVSEVQLAPTDSVNAEQLKGLSGQRVRVGGVVPAERLEWQARPLVVKVTELKVQR